jgi:tetratricopeptide (TPR) repeat protein
MRFVLPLLIIVFLFNPDLYAEDPETFSQAQALSRDTNKPILLEFFRKDCEYCQKAADEAERLGIVKNALQTVVHLSLNVREDKGRALSENYFVGNTFPVFILTNSEGEIIKRWVGYNGAPHFVRTLQDALKDLTTVKQRLARYKNSKNYQDAFFLAEFYADTREYLKAIDYYREAESFGQNRFTDFKFNIFQNYSNAAWNYVIPFEDILPAADDVLTSNRQDKTNLIKMIRILANVACKLGKTDKIDKYLLAGLELTSVSKNSRINKYHRELLIDKTLHVDNDTAESMSMKKADLGEDWQTNPDKFYKFSEYCLQRRANLEEARQLALKASKMAHDGPFKGKIVNTLADIYVVLGKYKEAVSLMELAARNDPDNDYYLTLIKQYRDSSAVQR